MGFRVSGFSGFGALCRLGVYGFRLMTLHGFFCEIPEALLALPEPAQYP